MGVFDPLTFTRASTKCGFNSIGELVEYPVNVPVIDHDPNTLKKLGVLIENARTNRSPNNKGIGAATGTPGTLPDGWSDAAGTLTRSVTEIGVENGIEIIELRYQGVPTASEMYVFFGPAIPAATGQIWSYSSFVKLVGGSLNNINRFQLVFYGVDSGGNVTDYDAHDFLPQAGGRIATSRRGKTTTLAQPGTVAVTFRFDIDWAIGQPIDVTFRIGLPQFEQGASVSSPIKTGGVAALRAADNIRMPFSPGAAYTVVTEAAPGTGIDPVFVQNVLQFDRDGDDSQRFVMRRQDQTSGRLVAFVGDTTGYTVLTATPWPIGQVARWAVAAAPGNQASAFRGNIDGVSAIATLPSSLNFLRVGVSEQNGDYFNGHIRSIVVYPSRLPNAEIQELTKDPS